uniref:toprim domain-containing protein n=1 Tax=Bacteroides fragilis TaxID=817 RepID=UPI00374E105D
MRLERCPDRPDLDGQDYIVLNSTSNLSKAIRPLGSYRRIHCFLDNDKAGMEAVQELREEYGLRVRDASHIYGGYNDLNDYLCGKRSEQAERWQEKPEPEKSQQKTEQPERIGKGIRM